MSTRKSTLQKQKNATVDWHDLARRMTAASAAIERGWTPSPEETRRTLKTRAQVLAREHRPEEAADACIEVVEFLLAYEHYAVESRCVREVYPLESLTPLPCTPAFVLGIINLRGEILSVIDIKKFFDLPEQGLTDLNKVIVLSSGSMLFGILADAIIGVHRVPIADIQPSLPTLKEIRDVYLRGVTPDRTVILDAEKLLSDANIIVQEQVDG
ncbi:MAG: chemotaxis protein CheW [Burkholderiales bacterium]